MKNNAFIALVILVITVAFLFVVNDLSKSVDPVHANAQKTHQQVDLVGFDRE